MEPEPNPNPTTGYLISLISVSISSPPSPPLTCCSTSCTPSLSGNLGRFASSCCPSSDSLHSRFGEEKLKECCELPRASFLSGRLP